MKVKFNTEELKKKLSQLGSVVAKKAAQPVYGFVRLFAVALPQTDLQPTKYQVRMLGVDIDSSLDVTFTKAEADGPVDVLIPFVKAVEIIGGISTQETTIDTNGEIKATIRAGKFKAEVKTHPLEQWPTALERPEKETAKIALPGFKDQIGQVEYAVPANEGKHIVTVALLEATAKTDAKAASLALVATDGFRLSISNSEQDAGEFKLILPKPALELVKKLEGSTLTILEADAGFYFETELEILTISRSHGEFPPYEQILPKSFKTQVTTKKKTLLESLKRLKPLADKETPIIAFAVAEGGIALALTANSNESGNDGSVFANVGEDEIDVTSTGPAVRFALNAVKLLQFVETAFGSADGDILIQVNDGAHVVDFLANDGKYRYLQMPTQDKPTA